MLIVSLLLVSIAAVAIIYYAQHELAHRCPGVAGCWVARLVLLAAGIAVGLAALHINAQYPSIAQPFGTDWLNDATHIVTLIVGLALVHLPAAGILFLKKQGPFVDHRDHLD